MLVQPLRRQLNENQGAFLLFFLVDGADGDAAKSDARDFCDNLFFLRNASAYKRCRSELDLYMTLRYGSTALYCTAYR